MAEHLRKFANNATNHERVFKPSINEDDIEKIMLIDDIDNHWKLLLMMGLAYLLRKIVTDIQKS